MCGIVGYVGKGKSRNFVLEGLSRLEYRGYDSAGFVCINDEHGQLVYAKEPGSVSRLKASLERTDYDGQIGMGHTRWATTGIINHDNAHPHFNCQKTVAVVHNGIIEDFETIRRQLIEEGHEFYSNTDTEVMAHLLSSLLKEGKTLHQAMVSMGALLKGAYAAVFLLRQYPDTLVLLRRRPPLAVGYGDGEMYAASDPLVFADKTKKILYMPEESFCFLTRDGAEVYDLKGNKLEVQPKVVDIAVNAMDKQGFEHYMLKEIYEEKKAIDRTVSFFRLMDNQSDNLHDGSWLGRSYYKNETAGVHDIWKQLGLTGETAKELRSLHLIGAGASWHAARIAQFFFEEIAKLPTRVHLSSEFSYMPFFPGDNSAAVFVTQSGETADTLEALRLVDTTGIPTIALTNVASSTIVRETGGALLMQAGPEISVCSTKAFSTQLASFYWLANRLALEKGAITFEEMKKVENDLFIAAEVLESTVEVYKDDIVQKWAKFYSRFDRFIFLGRNISYPFAMEAALKLKEISYVFAQCYPAGELKHGPIALVDERTPVVLFSSLDKTIYPKLIINAQAVKARQGHLVIFAFEGQDELLSLGDCSFQIPKVAPLLGPLAMTGIMQFFAYQIAKELGCPIDKPRNLAKSVTVE